MSWCFVNHLTLKMNSSGVAFIIKGEEVVKIEHYTEYIEYIL